jgi:hypothetical protein
MLHAKAGIAVAAERDGGGRRAVLASTFETVHVVASSQNPKQLN